MRLVSKVNLNRAKQKHWLKKAILENPQAGYSASARKSHFRKHWGMHQVNSSSPAIVQLAQQCELRYGCFREDEIVCQKFLKLSNLDPKASSNKLIPFLFSDEDELLMMKLKDFPDDLYLTIFNKALQVFAEKSLKKLSKLITEYSLQFKDPELERISFTTLTAWQYVFDTIHFFLQNEFITQEQYRNIFQEYNMLRELIYYTSNLFQIQSGAKFDDKFIPVTKHWYWTSDKNPFSVLRSREQERVIEFVSILESIKQNLGNLTKPDPKSQASLQRISNMLSSPDYFNTYKYIHESNPPGSYENESLQLGHQVVTDPKGFIAATRKLIHQMRLHTGILPGYIELLKKSPTDVCVSICYLLGFIERELSPGITKELIDTVSFLNSPNFGLSMEKIQDQTKEVIQLVFLTSRYHMLKEIAEKYWQIKDNASGNSTQGLAYNKSIYQGYLKEFAELLKDFKDVRLRFPSNDYRTGKFDDHLKYKIIHIAQDGEIQLNHFEATV
ncbi:hypothetical protein PGTUg99_033870 [Puccinia graminis f. sp. tritici]|uniref:Uncharacterized protein n=1 Tax=Puccinia graminis f. sp. tritici TaxID=56615 RepID=A0A5B0RXR9_PUCGR|nr:hypothetical protein PGTUg99_033870 [Puccinia graminis f. sp. tritici]